MNVSASKGARMDQLELQVSKREILGKKVRFLRRQGITPVHLFGHGIESLALQCDTDRLEHALAQSGHTTLIAVKLGSERKRRSVVVREIQRGSRRHELLHVDFYQVRMAEKIKVEVPVVLVGEAPALRSRDNTLVQELNALTVECLPSEIPTSMELNLSTLTEPEQVIRIKDVELGHDVVVLNDPELVVVRISSRPVEKIKEEVIAEEAVETPEAARLRREEQ
jgi:large subunit ribosomal protein L25